MDAEKHKKIRTDVKWCGMITFSNIFFCSSFHLRKIFHSFCLGCFKVTSFFSFAASYLLCSQVSFSMVLASVRLCINCVHRTNLSTNMEINTYRGRVTKGQGENESEKKLWNHQFISCWLCEKQWFPFSIFSAFEFIKKYSVSKRSNSMDPVHCICITFCYLI